jgi:NADH dehydrogenase
VAPHRVVIVGAGFAGLFAAKELRRADVEVTVIDRTNHHLFQPLLYQMATGILAAGDIAPPIRDILRGQRNATVILGEVVGIDLEARGLVVNTLGRRSEVPYDSLIIATGAQQSYFGHPEFAQYAPGMKTIDDALELRGRIFGAFELAECEPDPEVRRAWLTFVVVGAGPTGVELAGQIAELAHRSLRGNFRRINPADARVVLLDAAPTVLPPFPESLQRRAAHDLERCGVEIHLGAMVTAVDELGLDTSSDDPRVKRIEAITKIWAAGVQGSPLGRIVAEAAGAGVDRAGRVQVQPDLTLPGYPDVFVVGDLMSLSGLPGVAQVAIQSGRYAAKTIVLRLGGDTRERPFRYRDKGTLATISRFRAVASVGRVRVSGFPAWLLWLAVHLSALTGFKNRVAVLFNWTVAFLGRGRQQRAITTQQVFARQSLESQAGDIRIPGSSGPSSRQPPTNPHPQGAIRHDKPQRGRRGQRHHQRNGARHGSVRLSDRVSDRVQRLRRYRIRHQRRDLGIGKAAL